MNIQQELKKKHYGLYGNSAVQICLWTKNSLRGKGTCYKEKFYGINAHRCMQFSPVLECQERCIFCWRPVEILAKKKTKADNPADIIENLIGERKKLLSGFGSYAGKKKLEEAKNPDHFTLSLIGEPTLYPRLPEMISLLKKKGTVFLVTNGQCPEMLEKLQKQKALPTQLTLSVVAANKDLFTKICRPIQKNAWQIFNKTLALFPKLNCRKILRLVVIKGLNDDKKQIKEYSILIKNAKPDFMHIKGYTHIGHSVKRLKAENQPSHSEVKKLGKELIKHAKDYKIEGESEVSRFVLLKNRKSKYKTGIK